VVLVTFCLFIWFNGVFQSEIGWPGKGGQNFGGKPVKRSRLWLSRFEADGWAVRLVLSRLCNHKYHRFRRQMAKELTEEEEKMLAHVKGSSHVAQDSLMLYADSAKRASRPKLPPRPVSTRLAEISIQHWLAVPHSTSKRVEMSEEGKRMMAHVKELPHVSQDSLMLYSDSSKATRATKVPSQTATVETEDSCVFSISVVLLTGSFQNWPASGLRGCSKKLQRRFR